MTMIRIPWPPTALNAHAKGHWSKKARATAKLRGWAYAAALEARVQPDPRAVLRFAFHPPNNARRDLHNLFGPAAKAIIDGIAQAMGCDDRLFRCHFPAEFSPVVKGGLVIVEVTE